MKQASSSLSAQADLPTLQQLGTYLFASAALRQQWQDEVAQRWGQWQAESVTPVAQALLHTQAYGGEQAHWRVLGRSDTDAAVGFIEACAQRVLPEGIRWSVAQPEEVLDVETLFIEANQQLRVFGQQFYQLHLHEDVVVPVLVDDPVGFTTLVRRLGLGYGCFDAGVPIHTEHDQGYGPKQILFWVLYVVLVLWGVYHLAVWVFSWIWHWFD